MKLGYRNDRVLLAVLCIFFITVYIATYPQHAFYCDESSYLRLGNEILEGEYSDSILDRAPVLPFFVSVSYMTGLNPFQVKFLLPLIFGIFFIIVTYLIGKRFCRNPFIPVIIILSFAYFWKWVPFLLVDVLLGIFAGLALLYFYKGTEDDKKYLQYSFIFLALSILVKFSSILLLLIFLIYPLIRKKQGLFKTKEFASGFFIFIIIFIAAASLIYMSSGSIGMYLGFMSVEKFFREPSYYFVQFALIPWSLAFLYGIYRMARDKTKEGIFAFTSFLVVFVFFNLLVWKEMRFLIFIIPMFAVLIENGLQNVRKHAKYALIILFFAIGFAESLLLLNTVSYVTWGTDLMTNDLMQLEPHAMIAIDSLIIPDSSLKDNIIEIPDNITADWIEDNNIDYLVLSIYGEIRRNPDMSYYKPKIGFIDAPFLGGETPKNILVWWPEYEFNSELYNEINARYQPLKRIQFNMDQDVFIIYEVA